MFRDDLRYWLTEKREEVKLGDPDVIQDHAEVMGQVKCVKGQESEVMKKLEQEQKRLEAELQSGGFIAAWHCACFNILFTSRKSIIYRSLIPSERDVTKHFCNIRFSEAFLNHMLSDKQFKTFHPNDMGFYLIRGQGACCVQQHSFAHFLN